MFTQLIYFYIAIFLVFFLPGYFLMRAIFVKNYNKLSSLEKLLITFIFSLASNNAIMLLMNYFEIPIIRKNLFLGIIGTMVFFIGIWIIRTKITKTPLLGPQCSIFKYSKLNSNNSNLKQQNFTLHRPSYRQILFFIILLSFSVFLRGIYIADGIFPKTTDFGHHIYWANYISLNTELPTYSEKFIIGEHLPFAAMNILSHIPYISPLAVITLFLFNIFSLLGIFILVYYLANNLKNLIATPFSKVFGKKICQICSFDIALWALFIIGILYPISAPQVKFVSGGAIGNIIGNLLIITAIYAFLKSIMHKSTSFVALFLISVLTLVYTHHLSGFVFIYSFITILIIFIILTLIFTKINLKYFFKLVLTHLKPFITPLPLIIILIGLTFLFQIRTPSYLNPEAIDIAVGTPTKITRVGFGLSEIIERVGSWRMLFAGIFTIIVIPILFNALKNTFSNQKISKTLLTTSALTLSILFSWAEIILLMSWKPGALQVDIPSRRIITYLTYPITIMASFGIAYFFIIIKSKLHKFLVTFLFLLFMGIGIISGFGQDININERTYTDKSKEAMQTYLVAMYLASNSSDNEIILKDHKFLEGDTWMKLFFMRGYKYPLSRTYDHRYEDVINKRETCTRDMIAKPNSTIGQQCFAETKTKYIVLKKDYDDAIFKKSPAFQQVYSSETTTVFQRK